MINWYPIQSTVKSYVDEIIFFRGVDVDYPKRALNRYLMANDQPYDVQIRALTTGVPSDEDD